MFRVRHVASTLFSLAGRVGILVVGAGVLIGIFLKDGDDLTIGAEQRGKGRAVFSDQGTKVLVTMGDAVTGEFSTCVIQDQEGKELARVNSYHNGHVSFEFGMTSTVRGSGIFRKDGAVALGVISDVKHQYDVSVQPDGSSVVHAIVRDDRNRDRVRTVRVSPSGDVVSEQP
jgi:hypothetical protein